MTSSLCHWKFTEFCGENKKTYYGYSTVSAISLLDVIAFRNFSLFDSQFQEMHTEGPQEITAELFLSF